MSDLVPFLSRHADVAATGFALTYTAVPGLVLSYCHSITETSAAFYFPLLCLVATGRKRVHFGDDELTYDPGTYLIASVDLPVRGQVIEGPCFGVTFHLDLEKIASLLLEMPQTAPPEVDPLKGLGVATLGEDLTDPLIRLLKLLDHPADIPILAPVIEREILYRLLLGPHGAMLRQMALPRGPVGEIQRAMKRLRQEYDRSISVEALAQGAGMSATSFHRHFRAVTSMSPLQYLKGIRLHEARRLLVATDPDITRISADVGYESASQFSREYRRLFGVPPSADAARLRKTLVSDETLVSVSALAGRG